MKLVGSAVDSETSFEVVAQMSLLHFRCKERRRTLRGSVNGAIDRARKDRFWREVLRTDLFTVGEPPRSLNFSSKRSYWWGIR